MQRLLAAVAALLLLILLGVWGFMYLEGLNPLHALYLTIVTMTTTGYGDLVPVTEKGKLFVVFLLILSVGIIAYASTSLVEILLEGHLAQYWGKRSMKRDIQKLNNHFIVCGAGRVGENVVRRLMAEKKPYIAIEKDEAICRRLWEKEILVLQGDATKDEVLKEAGIERAAGLVSALPNDSDNVYVTLTAKALNPRIRVVARVERLEAESKLKMAGADRVICPATLGGYRMATAMIKPASVDFVETVLHRLNLEIVLEEIKVSPQSPLVDRQIRSSLIRSTAGITIVGIVRGNEFIMNPGGEEYIRANDILIVLGKPEQFEQIEALTVPPVSA